MSSSLFSKTITLRKELKITDDEFVQLRDFVYQQSGIYVADNRKYLLENRLCNRLKDLNLKSFGEYYYYLKYDPGRQKEMNRLFEVITTNETSFFRNPPQLQSFQEKILPEIIGVQAGTRKLRIWSAGCSTGEEPYTIAMILHEVLRGSVQQWDIRITANDLSEGVLKSAARGIFSEYSLRTTPRHLITRYMKELDGGRFEVRDEIKSMVSFVQINLSDRYQLKRVERSQCIFCRNVIIYFDDEMKRKVISGFYDNLASGGYLVIGHSESLHNISRAFKPIHLPGAIMYKKEG